MIDAKTLIRKANIDDAACLAFIHTKVWKEWYKGIVDQEFLDSMKEEELFTKWTRWLTQGIEEMFVAEKELHGIIGFIRGGKDRLNESQYTSEIYALYILPNYHRKGIGKSLVDEIVKAFKMKGHSKMRVWVLENNPAYIFYENIGGKIVGHNEIKLGNKLYNEIAYGYDIN